MVVRCKERKTRRTLVIGVAVAMQTLTPTTTTPIRLHEEGENGMNRWIIEVDTLVHAVDLMNDICIVRKIYHVAII
jgi:hypothetical protein